VVHLAWLIQPSRDLAMLEATNVEGSRRVFAAAAAVGAGTLVHASSIGAYSPGPKDDPVGEDHPTDGIPTSFYSRHKAAAERLLDRSSVTTRTCASCACGPASSSSAKRPRARNP